MQALAARNAWWDLSGADVELARGDLQVSLRRCAATFDLLFQATKGALSTSDEDTMKILQHMMARLIRAPKRNRDIVGVDEAAQVLKSEDQDEVK